MAQSQKRRRLGGDQGDGAEGQTSAGQRGGGAAGVNADVEEEELSGDDASLAGSDGMDRALDHDDDMLDSDPRCQPEPVDDADQVEYVNSLALPRAAPPRTSSTSSDESTAASQEPGSESNVAPVVVDTKHEERVLKD